MTGRERLVEIIKATPHGMQTLGDVIDSLYIENVMVEHLLENGVIVPPCKVGTTVYCIIDGFDTVAEGRVRFYTVHKDCIIYEVAINGYYAQRYTNKDFGYKIFFEREEAEKALRGGAINE